MPLPHGKPRLLRGDKSDLGRRGSPIEGDVITNHGYRGGPFVIDAADRDAALAIVDVWNDPATWATETWADRTVFNVVTVHEATAEFVGYVRKTMVAAPTIAVFPTAMKTSPLST